jgi:hypothetical protein
LSENETPPPPPDAPQMPPSESPADASPPSIPISFERVLETLECGAVTEEHGHIRWSSNTTLLLTVTHDDLSLLAVYKPQRGERPLWDFADGTLCQRERASFLVSEALGWRLVPPTALREGPRGLGSMQFFVEHDPEYHYFNFTPELRPQLRRLVLFDVITNNADRKGGHCLVDRQNHVWGIDQGLTFNTAPKLRTVIWEFAGEDIPDALLADLDRLCATLDDPESALRAALCGLLAAQEVNIFEARVRRLLKAKRFPKPGAGPNYPWPPV